MSRVRNCLQGWGTPYSIHHIDSLLQHSGFGPCSQAPSPIFCLFPIDHGPTSPRCAHTELKYPFSSFNIRLASDSPQMCAKYPDRLAALNAPFPRYYVWPTWCRAIHPPALELLCISVLYLLHEVIS